jgi:hypothetical protein
VIFYYFGGVGVRERSRYAAAVVFVMYFGGTLITWKTMLPGSMVAHVILSALLLSNLRATWIASGWKPESEEAILPPRLNENWRDKLVDQAPMWLWPRIEILYYIYSAGFMGMMAVINWMYLSR